MVISTSSLSNTGLFGLFGRLRDPDLKVFFGEFRVLLAELFDSPFGGSLDLLFVALVSVVEERAVTDLATAGWVIEVIVVRDGFGADVAVGILDTDVRLQRWHVPLESIAAVAVDLVAASFFDVWVRAFTEMSIRQTC